MACPPALGRSRRRRNSRDAATNWRGGGKTNSRDRPGMSAFAHEDGVVYHTYSTYARGLDGIWGTYPWLTAHPRDATKRAPGAAARTNTEGHGAFAGSWHGEIAVMNEGGGGQSPPPSSR